MAGYSRREIERFVTKVLESNGAEFIRIERTSNHAKLHFRVNNHQLKHSFASTPGDVRSQKNLAADIRRRINEWKKKPPRQ